MEEFMKTCRTRLVFDLKLPSFSKRGTVDDEITPEPVFDEHDQQVRNTHKKFIRTR